MKCTYIHMCVSVCVRVGRCVRESLSINVSNSKYFVFYHILSVFTFTFPDYLKLFPTLLLSLTHS